jgi:hypothetical protein
MNNPSQDAGARPERRKYPHLRAIYDEARQHIDHLFRGHRDPASGPMDRIAHRIIQQRYPNLSNEDIRILVGAIERVHQVFATAGKMH